jgi:uncharacterized protein YsxB (DUF464 family)
MIKIIPNYDGSTHELILSMEGHAGADEFGKDIICSACSVLCYTLAQVFILMDDRNELMEKPVTDIEDGKARIVARPKAEYKNEAMQSFYTVIVGFTLLAHNFPQYVDLVPLTDTSDKEIDTKESLT